MNQSERRASSRRMTAAILALVLILPAMITFPASAETATPGPACGGAPAGVLLAGTGFANGQPQPGLNVIEPATGKTLRTIDVPAVLSGLPASLPGHVLVETLDGDAYAIDVNTGEAVKIERPAGSTNALAFSSFRFASSAGSRWTLVDDGSQNDVLLVDLKTGAVINLKTVLAGKSTTSILVSAAVSADDAHVLVWDGVGLFVIPIAEPTQVRELGGDSSFAGSFSPDGTRVVYTRRTANATPVLAAGAGKAQARLIVENAAGGDVRVVATSPGTIQASWIDNDRLGVDQIAMAGSEKTGRFSVLSLETGSTLPVLPYAVDAARLVDVREGRWLLHEHDDGDHRLYTWIDLETGTLTAEPDLTNLFPAKTDGARWIAFFDPTSVVGKEGASYVGLDMETGKTVHLLAQHAADAYLPISSTTPDGQFAALTVRYSDATQLWLLDIATGSSRQIAISGTTGVAFSPDGCWLAIASMFGTGTERASTITLFPVDGGRPTKVGVGQAPIWLPTS